MLPFFATRPHYADHLRPILAKLPGATAWSPKRKGVWKISDDAHHADLPDGDGPVVVASAVDAQRFGQLGRPVIYLEHGAGQTYGGDPSHIDAARNPSYAGGAQLGNVIMFLCPNADVAARWRAVYPAATVRVIGCPRLDWHQGRDREFPGVPTVGFTFHWDCRVAPETRSAWPEYKRAVHEWAQFPGRPVRILGHSHPRLPEAYKDMGRWGWARCADVDAFLSSIDLLVADNTSLLYEACALGKSTIVLNSDHYRRDVSHGLRFWSHVPGRQVDSPAELRDALNQEIAHPTEYSRVRTRAAQRAYAVVDGGAAQRAADAIALVL